MVDPIPAPAVIRGSVKCGDCGRFIRGQNAKGTLWLPGPCDKCKRVIVGVDMPPLEKV